ncbi:hypothetical protein HanIR_Chr17g0903251 [Helianthus annuus]|nr:hypothetical protein HanIR_Chr17g0903251 [Helianthus annuus]
MLFDSFDGPLRWVYILGEPDLNNPFWGLHALANEKYFFKSPFLQLPVKMHVGDLFDDDHNVILNVIPGIHGRMKCRNCAGSFKNASTHTST